LQSFLGLANQLGVFHPGLAAETDGLCCLIMKVVELTWTPEIQDSFPRQGAHNLKRQSATLPNGLAKYSKQGCIINSWHTIHASGCLYGLEGCDKLVPVSFECIWVRAGWRALNMGLIPQCRITTEVADDTRNGSRVMVIMKTSSCGGHHLQKFLSGDGTVHRLEGCDKLVPVSFECVWVRAGWRALNMGLIPQCRITTEVADDTRNGSRVMVIMKTSSCGGHHLQKFLSGDGAVHRLGVHAGGHDRPIEDGLGHN
jgi:hypothetical protein